MSNYGNPPSDPYGQNPEDPAAGGAQPQNPYAQPQNPYGEAPQPGFDQDPYRDPASSLVGYGQNPYGGQAPGQAGYGSPQGVPFAHWGKRVGATFIDSLLGLVAMIPYFIGR